MRTGRGFERLVNFTDAVIAIAVTLLVLPLVEIPQELGEGEHLGEVFADHRAEFGAFALSFLVIWVLWLAHHHTMEYFKAYDSTLMRLHMIWLFTIVTLPFSTQLLSTEDNGDGEVPLYVGTLFLSSLILLGIAWQGRRKHELLHADRAEVQDWLSRRPSFYAAAVLGVSFVLSPFFPTPALFVLLLLLFESVADRITARLTGRPAATEV
jgi:uncharacterized membrane protein